MTIVCTGWKRLTPTVSLHDPKCDLPSSSHDLDVNHSMSEACERCYRTAHNLPPKQHVWDQNQ